MIVDKYYSVQWLKNGNARVDTFSEKELIEFYKNDIAESFNYIVQVPNKHIPYDYIIKKIKLINNKFPFDYFGLTKQ